MDDKQVQEHQEKADSLQQQINDLHTQADAAGGAEKESLMDRIKQLEEEKNSVMQKLQDYETQAKRYETEAKSLETDATDIEIKAQDALKDLHL